MSCSFYKQGYSIFEQKIDFLYTKYNEPLKLIIGVSGGSDSSLLLEYIHLYKKKHTDKIARIICAYIDDGLGIIMSELAQGIDKAQKLIIEKTKEYGYELEYFKNSDPSLLEKYESYEDAGHHIRKEFFLKLKAKYQAHRIILAHTENDQVEHFFIGIIRQSSLKRISGMEEDSTLYYRPFLTISKEVILAALQEKNITYIDDPGNKNVSFLRNRIRNQLIPILKTIDDRTQNSIISTMQEIKELEKILETTTEIYINEIREEENKYNREKFLKLPEKIQFKILEKLFYQTKATGIFNQNIFKEITRFLLTSKKNKYTIKQIEVRVINNVFFITLTSICFIVYQ